MRLVIPTIVCMFLIVPAGQSSSVADGPQKLAGHIARWAAEARLADLVGGFDGKACGGASLAEGRRGPALAFDGKSGYVELQRSNLIAGRKQFTISAWVKHESAGWIMMQGGYCEDQAPVRLGRSLWFGIGADGRIQINLQGQHGWWHEALNRLDSCARIEPGGWHHIAIVFESGDFALYIDGQRDDSKTKYYNHSACQPANAVDKSLFDTVPATSDTIRIGCAYNYEGRRGATCNHWKGTLEGLAVWERALSAKEVAAVAAAPAGEVAR